MNKLEQAARQALEALIKANHFHDYEDEITALREALAEQAEQEPKYFGLTHDHTWLSIDKKQYDKLKPEGRMACYTAPVRTKDLCNPLQDLTDDEIEAIVNSVGAYEVGY